MTKSFLFEKCHDCPFNEKDGSEWGFCKPLEMQLDSDDPDDHMGCPVPDQHED